MAVDITPSLDGGVLKEILTAGEGDIPCAGCKVKAHYHGTLTDGTVFDSSVNRGEPFEFTLGQGQVIKAWDLGVATMKTGEKARLTCKAKYAYGDSGSPPKIPGGATLIFDITLISWSEEDLSVGQDGGILRTVITPGEGYAKPAEFCLCKVQLKGSVEGCVFDEREVTFSLGESEASDLNIPSGIEVALTKMQKGETARLTLAPSYGWPDGNTQLGVAAGATLKYEVTLLEFEKDKEAWDMESAQKLDQASLLKNRATEYFQKAKYNIAAKLYAKASTYIDSTHGFSEVEEMERLKLLLAIRLNLALLHLKKSEYYEAKLACEQALELDSNSVKALFRRGQALLAIGEPEAAKLDFERVIKLELNNTAASAQILVCNKRIAEIKAKERKIYSNMFEKFASKDKEKERVELEKLPDTMGGVLGEWDAESRQGMEMTDFEKENPDVLLLNKQGLNF